MAAYKDLVGQKITKVSSNPSDPKTGQMWYNSTAGFLRGLGIVEAFSSASPIITAATRGAGFGPVGGPNIMFGGVTPPSTYVNTQIEYNGSGWASDGTYPQSLQGVGVTGVSTAAISVGGNNAGPPSFPSGVYNGPALEYNGSSWTSAPAYPVTSITQIANAGTETAAVFAAGYTYDPGSYTTVTNTNEYNGSSFSSGNAVNTGRQTTVSAGTQTAAIMAGGDIWTSPGATATSNATEQYDGTSWTSVSNHPKSFSGHGFNSKSENTIINGAIPGGPDSTVFKYDGSSWSTIPGLATGRYQAASGTGSPTNVLCVSGRNPGWVTSVEEYNKSTNTVTAAAWASSPALNTGRYSVSSTGTTTAALCVGGQPAPGYYNKTEEYNGSSWSEVTNYPLSAVTVGSTGPQTAALLFGGNTHPPSVDRTDSFTYDGSSFSSAPALPVGRRGLSSTGLGTQTAALQSGGQTPANSQTTSAEYDGSSWTAGNAMNTARYNHGGFGTQTAGAVAGGSGVAPGYNPQTNVEEYNGTSFTSVNPLNTARDATASTNLGTQTDSMIIGGGQPSLANCESYDGTTFSTTASLATARQALGASGPSSSSALAFGGYSTTTVNVSEEFTGETTAVNLKAFG